MVRQAYRTHHLTRKIIRNIELKKNKELVLKNKDVKILVILHLFYPKSWKEIQEYLDNLSCYNYDLIVTTTKGKVPGSILNEIKNYTSNVKIIECKNIGYDLRPFLIALKTVNLDDYEIVFKLQSKSTKRSWIYIYNQLFMRRDWFLDLFEGVLSSKVVHQNIDILANNDSVGLVAAENLIVSDPLHKIKMVQRIAKDNNFFIKENYKFVAGTCFGMKAECLQNIKEYVWNDDDFIEVPSTRGMSFAHFFERYICIQVESVWNKKMLGTEIRPLRHLILSLPEKILYRYSSNRLFDEDIDFDPEVFYWLLDNKLIKWRYEEIPFKNILYVRDDIRRPFIENEPYRYLKGDIEGYKKYCEYHLKNGLPVMSIDRFNSLIESINENGYDKRKIIIVNSKNELMDGQHRAACLCNQLGEEASLKVLKIRFIGIKEGIKKILPDFIWKRLKEIRDRNEL